MDSAHQQEILKTLLYSDIFHYPLTFDELWRFAGKKMDRRELKKALNKLSSCIAKEGEYYYLTGRRGIVKKREERAEESEKKIQVAKQSVLFLRLIPTVVFIGISGSVAMRNCKKEDDIDLFIITRKNTVWLTRLCVLLFLQLLGKRRRRQDTWVKDRLCVNMFMPDDALTLLRERHSLYTAHEVARMIPIFERDNVYSRFLVANRWVSEYLPNALKHGTTQNRTLSHTESFSLVLRIVPLISVLELFARTIQLWYMKGHQTTEEISDTLLAFHPKDLRPRVLHAFEKRLEKYHL